MLSPTVQRQLQEKIDQAKSDPVIGYRVNQLIAEAEREYKDCLALNPPMCGSGLVGAIYHKLLSAGLINEDTE